jgi:hypothetical protein
MGLVWGRKGLGWGRKGLKLGRSGMRGTLQPTDASYLQNRQTAFAKTSFSLQ